MILTLTGQKTLKEYKTNEQCRKQRKGSESEKTTGNDIEAKVYTGDREANNVLLFIAMCKLVYGHDQSIETTKNKCIPLNK